MKKSILCLALAILISLSGISQSLSDKSMTFYGIDFSKARMSDPAFKDGDNVKDHLFMAWNSLFKVEAEKYDVAKTFKKDKVDMDFDNTERNNKAVDAKQILTNNDYKLASADAEAVVKGYNTTGKTGLGCVIVLESFSKDKVKGSMYVIFFDQASKKIILSKYMEGKAGGFGVKNYYAATIRNVLNECQSQYPKWLKGK